MKETPCARLSFKYAIMDIPSRMEVEPPAGLLQNRQAGSSAKDPRKRNLLPVSARQAGERFQRTGGRDIV